MTNIPHHIQTSLQPETFRALRLIVAHEGITMKKLVEEAVFLLIEKRSKDPKYVELLSNATTHLAGTKPNRRTKHKEPEDDSSAEGSPSDDAAPAS